MKPDEHKKKKSAQYRKKHGDSTSQTQKNTVLNKGSSRGDKTKGKNSNESVKKTTIASIKSDSDSSDQDDNTNEPHFEKKTFQRRQIVSNWDRYELPPEDKSDETKGTDVTELLKLSGSASYHFSLKDEKEWDSITKESTPTEYLSIDLENLSAALSCIPLYKRLRLDKSLFSESQIEAMNNDATESEKTYKPVNKKHFSTQEQTVSEDCDVNNLLLHNLDLRDENEPNINRKENFKDSVNNLSNSESQTSTSVQNQRMEKDLLFLIENTTEAENSDNIHLQKDNTVSKNVVKTEPSNAIAVNKDSEPGVEDLEDWLDSVLDN